MSRGGGRHPGLQSSCQVPAVLGHSGFGVWNMPTCLYDYNSPVGKREASSRHTYCLLAQRPLLTGTLLSPASECGSPAGGTCFEKQNQNSHVEMSTMDWSVLKQMNVFFRGARTLWFKSTAPCFSCAFYSLSASTSVRGGEETLRVGRGVGVGKDGKVLTCTYFNLCSPPTCTFHFQPYFQNPSERSPSLSLNFKRKTKKLKY